VKETSLRLRLTRSCRIICVSRPGYHAWT